MIWIFTAILSHFFWAVTNVGDKFFIANKIKNPQTFVLTKTFCGGLISLLIFPLVDFGGFDSSYLFWIALDVLFFLAGNYFYIKAIQVEEISRINIYWSFIPFFSFIIAWFAIGEKLSGQQIVAMIFLVAGAIIAGLNIKNSAVKLSKGFWFMAISCLVYSFAAVVIRFLSDDNSYLSIFFWNGFFFSIFSAMPFVSKKIRRGFSHDFKDSNVCVSVLALVFLDSVAGILNVFSISKGPVALVYSIEGFQSIFVFIIVGLIAYLTKIDIQESLEKKNLLVKIVALCTMLIGINLL